MTLLFKSLAKTEIGNVISSSSSIDKAPAFPLTAVQLYSTKHVHFMSNTIQHTSASTAKATATAAINTKNATSDINQETKSNDTRDVSNATSKSKYFPKPFEILSYQPVHVSADSTTNTGVGTGTGTLSLTDASSSLNNKPNLGVWDCHLTFPPQEKASKRATHLIQSALHHYTIKNQLQQQQKQVSTFNKPTFLITIDLEDLSNVQPTLSAMMDSILSFLQKQQQQEQQVKVKDEQIATSTTSALPKFGTAAAAAVSASDETNIIDSNHVIHNASIIIGAVLPLSSSLTTSTSTSSNNASTYQEKQGLNLVCYHLLKYSKDLNCTLLFLKQQNEELFGLDDIHNNNNMNMNDKVVAIQDEKVNTGIIPQGMNVEEFAMILRNICFNGGIDNSSSTKKENVNAQGSGSNKDNDKLENEDQEEGGGNTKNGDIPQQHLTEQPSIYYPNQYDEDLIDSVYLRSASCPGVWDATKDNLWVALPPPASSSSINDSSNNHNDKDNKNTSSDGAGFGDEDWLSNLAESVNSYGGGSGGGSVLDGNKSVMMDEASAKTSRTSKMKDGGTVSTKGSKRTIGKKKPAGNASTKKASDVSDFFTDLLNN